ncbi:MAG: pseudomurein-binding repeat-containing protein [Methanothermobacter tenebrarum]
MAQLLYLLTSATVNINAGNLAPINPRSVAPPPSPGGSYRHGRLYKSEYLRVAGNIMTFIGRYGRAPNYASTSLGRIPFQRLVYMYSKIIAFYGTNNRLPNYVRI